MLLFIFGSGNSVTRTLILSLIDDEIILIIQILMTNLMNSLKVANIFFSFIHISNKISVLTISFSDFTAYYFDNCF